MTAIRSRVTDRQLLENEARRVEQATSQHGAREGRAVLTEILNRARKVEATERTLALDFNARLCTLLRERDESRSQGMRHNLWSD